MGRSGDGKRNILWGWPKITQLNVRELRYNIFRFMKLTLLPLNVTLKCLADTCYHVLLHNNIIHESYSFRHGRVTVYVQRHPDVNSSSYAC